MIEKFLKDFGFNPKHPIDADQKNSAGQTILLVAVIQRNTLVFDYLIDNLANVNLASESGHTPLMGACWHNDLYMISTLLKKGANPQLKNENDQDAIHFASYRHSKEAIELLQSYSSPMKTHEEITDLAGEGVE